jgi:hypothetical protein
MLFIYGLFNDAVSSSDHLPSEEWLVNDELERILKEAVVGKSN